MSEQSAAPSCWWAAISNSPIVASDDRAQRLALLMTTLSEAVDESFDPQLVIRRALWLLGCLCRRNAVAFLQLEPRADLQGDFSLRCQEYASSDQLLVAVNTRPHDSWRELLSSRAPVIMHSRPARGEYPGLEPLLHRFEEGFLALLPLQGKARPLGVLVLCDLWVGSRQQPPLTSAGLRAVGQLLSSALENALLFSKINETAQTLRATQDQLVHTEKFAAVGMLAAQVAHEINNPASFVIANLSVMVDYVAELGAFYSGIEAELEDHPALAEVFTQLAEEHEVDFMREDLDALLNRSLAGMQRIHQIVRDLRYFSHDAPPDASWVDIEGLLRATVNLVKHEAKYHASIEMELEPIPSVFTDANRLSQVFLNLLVNAVQAIEPGSPSENHICLRTRQRDEGWIVVSVEDTGHGIAREELKRIFEPFYTTKPQGVGTGLGLSITKDIVERLGGRLRVDSAPGQGATFAIDLPVRGAR